MSRKQRAPVDSGVGTALRNNFDVVILDHRIGQQLLAHIGNRGAGRRGVALVEFDFDILALANVFDAAEVQAGEGLLNGLTLRVENTIFQGDVDTCFQGDPRNVWVIAGSQDL